MTGRCDWLADQLRRWSIPVREVDGSRTRGKSSLNPLGVIVHHDALNSSTPAAGAVALMVHGRPDLPGPLCQLWLDDDDDYTAATGDPVCYVIATGRANHAGAGNWYGVSGNSQLLGIEARNNGRGEQWSPAMILTYMRVCAALCEKIGRHAGWVAGHKEYALPRGRKIDPTGIDMNAFRSGVQGIIDRGPGLAPPPRLDPIPVPPPALTLEQAIFLVKQVRLGPGLENPHDAVVFLQTAINDKMHRGLTVNGVWDQPTAQAIIDLQRFVGVNELGFVGRQTWDLLLPPPAG